MAALGTTYHKRKGSKVDDSLDFAGNSDGKAVETDPTGRYLRYPELLGRGACKRVFRGFDTHEGFEVAWNQVELIGLEMEEEVKERLFSEIKVLQHLKHRNIMSFYDWWYDKRNHTINFITEVFTSGTLRQFRKKTKHVNEHIIKRWAWQILEGLVYLHGHDPPIVHRDLKCDNIFVNGTTGQVKIGDLGLATAQQGLSVVGTPEFMAPEIYDEQYDEKVDIYSFGMCLLELATLEYPYSECHGVAQIFRKVTQGVLPQALQRVRSPHLRAVIELCIAHKAEERPEARQLLKHPFFESCRQDGLHGSNSSPQLNYTWSYNSTPPGTAPSSMTNFRGLVATHSMQEGSTSRPHSRFSNVLVEGLFPSPSSSSSQVPVEVTLNAQASLQRTSPFNCPATAAVAAPQTPPSYHSALLLPQVTSAPQHSHSPGPLQREGSAGQPVSLVGWGEHTAHLPCSCTSSQSLQELSSEPSMPCATPPHPPPPSWQDSFNCPPAAVPALVAEGGATTAGCSTNSTSSTCNVHVCTAHGGGSSSKDPGHSEAARPATAADIARARLHSFPLASFSSIDEHLVDLALAEASSPASPLSLSARGAGGRALSADVPCRHGTAEAAPQQQQQQQGPAHQAQLPAHLAQTQEGPASPSGQTLISPARQARQPVAGGWDPAIQLPGGCLTEQHSQHSSSQAGKHQHPHNPQLPPLHPHSQPHPPSRLQHSSAASQPSQHAAGTKQPVLEPSHHPTAHSSEPSSYHPGGDYTHPASHTGHTFPAPHTGRTHPTSHSASDCSSAFDAEADLPIVPLSQICALNAVGHHGPHDAPYVARTINVATLLRRRSGSGLEGCHSDGDVAHDEDDDGGMSDASEEVIIPFDALHQAVDMDSEDESDMLYATAPYDRASGLPLAAAAFSTTAASTHGMPPLLTALTSFRRNLFGSARYSGVDAMSIAASIAASQELPDHIVLTATSAIAPFTKNPSYKDFGTMERSSAPDGPDNIPEHTPFPGDPWEGVPRQCNLQSGEASGEAGAVGAQGSHPQSCFLDPAAAAHHHQQQQQQGHAGRHQQQQQQHPETRRVSRLPSVRHSSRPSNDTSEYTRPIHGVIVRVKQCRGKGFYKHPAVLIRAAKQLKRSNSL